MRTRLFEFEDLPRFPSLIRGYMTDYLMNFLNAVNFYEPVSSVIKEGLEHSGCLNILDLCSGSGGPILKVQQNFKEQYGQELSIMLTDKFPNPGAYEHIACKSGGSIHYSAEAVDATAVPGHLHGLRTIFSGFHHFDGRAAKQVIGDAVGTRSAIAIVDGGDRNVATALGIILFHPIAFLLCTPFFRPFRWSRILFTYVIPIVPFCTVWDGVVSIIRLYQPSELLALAQAAAPVGYVWKAGKLKNRWGMSMAYLLGYPETHTAHE